MQTNSMQAIRYPRALDELEQQFARLAPDIPDGPNKQALSVLHGIVMQIWRTVQHDRMPTTDGGVREIADLWQSAPPMEGAALTSGLPIGVEAPDFTLPDASGTPVRLSDLRGQPVVLMFYPLDWSTSTGAAGRSQERLVAPVADPCLHPHRDGRRRRQRQRRARLHLLVGHRGRSRPADLPHCAAPPRACPACSGDGPPRPTPAPDTAPSVRGLPARCRCRRGSSPACAPRHRRTEVTLMINHLPEPHRPTAPTGPGTGEPPRGCMIATWHLNGTVRVAIDGEIDLAVHERLRDVLTTALDARPAVELVVDLTATTFLDASGIGILLQAQHEARRTGRRLRITNPQHPAVRQVLQITGTLQQLADLR